MRGFIVYPTYRVIDNQAYVHLYGRLENGESFVTINLNRPYFYIKQTDLDAARKLLDVDYEPGKMKNFDDEPLIKVVLDKPYDIPNMKKLFLDNTIICYEADIRFSYRFMIDHGLKGSINIEGDFEKGREGRNAQLNVNRVYRDAKIEPSDYFPELKTLSIDIETNRDGKILYAISLYAKDYEKVLIVKDGKFDKAECFKDERALLERFKEIILELDSDVIVGWNVIDFDFKILMDKFNECKIPFNLGRDEATSTLRLSDSFFINSSAKFSGRIVLDGIALLKDAFIRLKNYKLSTAAETLLGEKKIFEGEDRWKDIEESYEKDPQKLIEYNLNDSKLVYDIIEKTGTLALSIRRSMLAGMQLDRVSASIASFDSVYLREINKVGYVAPSSNPSDRDERIKGGFVRQSKPGIYDNILVLDFKSLYPSIIRTFNIDPLRFVPKKDADKYKKEELIEAPNGACFKRQQGILPKLLEKLWVKRDIAKKEKNKLANQAIKLLMNSFFGILANPSCRFYSIEMANAITHFGQHLIKLCAETIENDKGYDVIYGDTDSIFVNVSVSDYGEAQKIGKDIEEYVNRFFKKHIEEDYKLKNFMEIEFEKTYKKFLMPHVRGSDTGAKKRYAGILEKDGKDVMDFVGLEFVRSDWTDIAKKLQLALLEKVFAGEDITSYVEEFIDELMAGKYDNEMIYRKAIRKNVSAYTKTTPPHIKAARKIGRDKTGIIEYVMTVDGPEAIEAIKHKIDYDHYINKQLRPIADSILIFFGKKFEDFLNKEQKSLFDY